MSAINAWNMERLSWPDFALLSDILGRELRLNIEDYGTVIGFHAIPGNDEAVLPAAGQPGRRSG